MRIFVCEFLTSGGARADPMPGKVMAEALLLRTVLVNDLESVPGLSVLLAQDDRLGPSSRPAAPVTEGSDAWEVWQRVSAGAQLVWPLAREDRRVADLARRFRALGARVIGHQPEALDHLHEPGWLSARLATAGIPADIGDMDSRGEPVSLSILARSDGNTVLALHQRQMAPDGSVAATVVGARAERTGPLAALANAVVAAVPGLAGIFDIDLRLRPEGAVVTAVSSGLALSYVGLHRSLGINPVAFLPDFIRDGRPPQMPHLPQPVAITVKLRA